MKVSNILKVLGIIIVVALIFIPKTFFMSTGKVVEQPIPKLTNGPTYINNYLENEISIKAISGDMANTAEYLGSDLVTPTQAIEALNNEYLVLNTSFKNLNSLTANSDINTYVEQSKNDIENLKALNRQEIQMIENNNISGLVAMSSTIGSVFSRENLSSIGNYKIDKDAYSSLLSEKTIEYNSSKTHIS